MPTRSRRSRRPRTRAGRARARAPRPTARLRGRPGPGWRAAAGGLPDHRAAAALLGVLGCDPLAAVSAALHPCSAPAGATSGVTTSCAFNQHQLDCKDAQALSGSCPRALARTRESDHVHDLAHSANRERDAAVAEGRHVVAHPLRARPGGASAAERIGSCIHSRQGAGLRRPCTGPGRLRQRPATPAAGILAECCGAPRAALLARPTRYMPGLRGACTKTDACTAVWGVRQPPGAGLLRGVRLAPGLRAWSGLSSRPACWCSRKNARSA